jgi:predicted Fe-Mo cluster-binding NifX family protein
MKIAIPTRGTVVDDHFGHCETYTVFNIGADRLIERTELLPSPAGCGCKSNIAAILRDKGITVMLAGNMGDGAYNILRNHGIEVYRGCSGEVSKVVDAFLQDRTVDSGEGCHHHGQHSPGHECNH